MNATKKRRVWWIVGSLVVAVALFAAVAFIVDYNSTDARIGRAVARIVDEYGFEQTQSESYGSPFETGGAVEYSRTFDTMEETVRILSALKAACQGYDYIHHVLDDGYGVASDSGLEPVTEMHVFASDDSRVRELVVVFQLDEVGSGPEQSASLFMSWTTVQGGLWERINGLWPW